MSSQTILANAKKAKCILADMSGIHEKLKWFHIRPTATGVTLVSTHQDRMMRGIQGVAISKLGQLLATAASAVSDDGGIDWDTITYNKQCFIKRTTESKKRKNEKEFRHQAQFINEIINNSKVFSDELHVAELFFLGSEVIFQLETTSDGQRIDVVAHDGNGKVLFFEFKSSDNAGDNPHEQVVGYIKKYRNNEDFQELLRQYPAIHTLDAESIVFEGWVVRGDETSGCLTFEKAVL